jgi:hypothetical protein
LRQLVSPQADDNMHVDLRGMPLLRWRGDHKC